VPPRHSAPGGNDECDRLRLSSGGEVRCLRRVGHGIADHARVYSRRAIRTAGGAECRLRQTARRPVSIASVVCEDRIALRAPVKREPLERDTHVTVRSHGHVRDEVPDQARPVCSDGDGREGHRRAGRAVGSLEAEVVGLVSGEVLFSGVDRVRGEGRVDRGDDVNGAISERGGVEGPTPDRRVYRGSACARSAVGARVCLILHDGRLVDDWRSARGCHGAEQKPDEYGRSRGTEQVPGTHLVPSQGRVEPSLNEPLSHAPLVLLEQVLGAQMWRRWVLPHSGGPLAI
jgi:hypothetical protein